MLKAIETGWVHPTLNQHNLVDEVSGIDTVPLEKKKHEVGPRRLLLARPVCAVIPYSTAGFHIG